MNTTIYTRLGQALVANEDSEAAGIVSLHNRIMEALALGLEKIQCSDWLRCTLNNINGEGGGGNFDLYLPVSADDRARAAFALHAPVARWAEDRNVDHALLITRDIIRGQHIALATEREDEAIAAAQSIIDGLPNHPEGASDPVVDETMRVEWENDVIARLNEFDLSPLVTFHLQRLAANAIVASWAEFVREFKDDFRRAALDIAANGDVEYGGYFDMVANAIAKNL